MLAAKVSGIDISQVKSLADTFKSNSVMFATAFLQVRPEFGAYMMYSAILELGGVQKTYPARPHIIPSVIAKRDVILKEILTFQMNALKQSTGQRNSQGQFVAAYAGGAATKDALEKAWMRALNGAVRPHAVNMAKQLEAWQYGFHARSIHGYVTERPVSEIKAEYEAAMRERKLKQGKKK